MSSNLQKKSRLLSGKDLFFLGMGQCIGAGIITNTGLAIPVFPEGRHTALAFS